MNVHPHPKISHKAIAHYDIDIYRIRPDFSGKIMPCKVMKDIKKKIPFKAIGISRCNINNAVTLYPKITGDLIIIMCSEGPDTKVLDTSIPTSEICGIQVSIPTPMIIATPLFSSDFAHLTETFSW